MMNYNVSENDAKLRRIIFVPTGDDNGGATEADMQASLRDFEQRVFTPMWIQGRHTTKELYGITKELHVELRQMVVRHGTVFPVDHHVLNGAFAHVSGWNFLVLHKIKCSQKSSQGDCPSVTTSMDLRHLL